MATVVILLAAAAHAQVPPAPSGTDGAAPERPGLFRAGTFYLTPYLHIGTMGIDTNVFYTATDRQTDFTASGGPGLEIVRPFGKSSSCASTAGSTTSTSRGPSRSAGSTATARPSSSSRGSRRGLSSRSGTRRPSSRPNYEVNERVQQETEGTQGVPAAQPRRPVRPGALREPAAHDDGQPGLPGHESRRDADGGHLPGRGRAADGPVGEDAARGRGRAGVVPLPAPAGARRRLDAGLRRLSDGRDGAHRRAGARGLPLVPARHGRQAQRRLRQRGRRVEPLAQDEAGRALCARLRLLRVRDDGSDSDQPERDRGGLPRQAPGQQRVLPPLRPAGDSSTPTARSRS